MRVTALVLWAGLLQGQQLTPFEAHLASGKAAVQQSRYAEADRLLREAIGDAEVLDGDLDSLGGEPGPVVGVVDDEAQRCELAEHLAHRSRADPHLLCEAGVGYDGLGSARDTEQSLEVVLLCCGCSAASSSKFRHT